MANLDWTREQVEPDVTYTAPPGSRRQVDNQTPNLVMNRNTPTLQSSVSGNYPTQIGDFSGNINAQFGGLQQNKLKDLRTPAEKQMALDQQLILGKPQSALTSYTASRDSMGQSFNPSVNAKLDNRYGSINANLNGTQHNVSAEAALSDYINAKANYSRDRVNQIDSRGVDIRVGNDDNNLGYKSNRRGNNPSTRDLSANAKLTDAINANARYGNAGQSVGANWAGDDGWSANVDFTQQVPGSQKQHFRNNDGNRLNLGLQKSFGQPQNIVPKQLLDIASQQQLPEVNPLATNTAWDAYKDIRI